MIDVEATVREHISKIVHMSLATCADNAPWVCEVHFACDEDLNLYFRSKPDRRHSVEITRNPAVAGNIVRQHELGEPVVGLYYEGTAEVVTDVSVDHPAYKSMQARGLCDEKAIEEVHDPSGHQFYKISVKNWYVFGRFGQPNGQKYKLEWK